MWILSCFFLLALGGSAAASPLKSCGPQNIVLKQLTDTWSLPVTKMDPMSTCTYTFEIPKNIYAEVNVTATGLGNQDTISAVGILRSFKGPNDSYQIVTLSPSQFQVTLSAGKDSMMSAEISVNLKQVSIDGWNMQRVLGNSDPFLLYLDEWRVGIMYGFYAADTLVRLSVAFNGLNTRTQYLLNNIFVYDGQIDNTPTTLLDYASSYYLSKEKKVYVYLAKKINYADLQGALFFIDNSNVDGLLSHTVQFVPTDPNSASSWVSIVADPQNKPDALWGAVTIIGKSGGTTPIDVRSISNVKGNGTFLYAHAGPLPNHPNAEAFDQKNLPLHGWGVMNTFYLSQGDGSLRYTIS